MSLILQIFFIIAASLFSLVGLSKEATKRNQLEEFFIWKLSDEMKLSSNEEKKFSEVVKKLNEKKSQLNQELQNSIDILAKTTDPKKRDLELVNYRKSLHDINQVSEMEFDKIKSLLGSEKTVQYILIKQDLTKKLKSILANPDGPVKNESKLLPAPKLIEEK